MKNSMWKCRAVEGVEIQTQDSHASHRPWKSLRDSHIPTRTTIPPILIQGPERDPKMCYLCPRIKVLPMSPAGQARLCGDGNVSGRIVVAYRSFTVAAQMSRTPSGIHLSD